MINKKNDKANLEKKRGLFFQIALIIAFSLVLFAFEWDTAIGGKNTAFQIAGIDIETELVPITRQKELKPPEPKKHIEFKILEDNEPVEEEAELPSTEIDPNEGYVTPEMLDTEEDFDHSDPVIWDFTELAPEFPGGMKALLHYLGKHIKYPTIAVENDIQGKVYVRFVINEKGELGDAQVIRSVDSLLDKEALRVVSNLPKWKPGRQAGKPVSVWFTIPIVFVLE